MEVTTILFPSSYFDGRKVDEDLINEYEAAVNTGLWDILFFNYDKWFSEGRLVLSGPVEKPVCAVHRGWMMKAERYGMFYEELQKQKIELTTNPAEYEHFHYFPNVYNDIRDDTPLMITAPFSKGNNLEEIKSRFKRFMVKDYVKSVKGTEFPKFFTSDVSEEQFEEAMEIFYKYRGDMLAGGLCFKEYVELKQYGDKTNEYRVFYIGGEVATVSRNSLQAQYTPEPPIELIEKYKGLPSRFYTLDFAEVADGSWRILEAGDGGVSGPSEGQDLETFYRTMYICLNH